MKGCINMTKNGVVLTAKKLREKLENGEWKINGKTCKPLTLFVQNRYFDIYDIQKTDDSTVYYGFDDYLKLYKIIRKNHLDRVVETGGTVADIVDVGITKMPKAFEDIDMSVDVKSYE